MSGRKVDIGREETRRAGFSDACDAQRCEVGIPVSDSLTGQASESV